MKTLGPDSIIEWIPYNNLKNIKYLTKGGYSEIYTAEWVDGSYDEWDSNQQQLKRFGEQNVVLKRLENLESANKRWFEEANSHLNITFHSNKSHNFHIPNNIDDFDKLNNQKNSSKIISIFKVGNIQETMQQQIKKYHDDIDDDEIHNNPNLHSEEQDELELPDNIDK
ncbi:unnamed protein product [Rhizophagus irregularis]|nr:unnamed protein product [Rhizophagus irregularis]